MFTQNSLASALSLVGSLTEESKTFSPTAPRVASYVFNIKECDSNAISTKTLIIQIVKSVVKKKNIYKVINNWQ